MRPGIYCNGLLKGQFMLNAVPGILIISLCLLSGCNKQSSEDAAHTVVDVRALPKYAPKEKQAQLVWGLYKLDEQTIQAALDAGVCPYSLATSVKGLRPIAGTNKLSPYGIALEGYLSLVAFKNDFETVRQALDRVYSCIEFLIKNNISVDRGVVTLGAQPTMRGFVSGSLARLYAERIVEGELNEEGDYALANLEHIQALIDEYQPQQ